MRPRDAEKLLGGHATGTLTEAERKALYAAALEDQALFDALVDEEALRELLADPGARDRLLAALAPADTAPARVVPRSVPFWRRPGLIGAAAGLLVASLAGLTWLRNPQAPTPVHREALPSKALELDAPAAAPAERDGRTPAPTRPEAPRRREAAPPSTAASPGPVAAPPLGAVPPPPPAPAAVPAPVPAPAAQDNLQKAAEASAGQAPAARVVEVLAAGAPTPVAARAKAAPAQGRLDEASGTALPTWTLALQPDGTTLVTVSAPQHAPVELLKRGAGSVEVLQGRALVSMETRQAQWRFRVRLKAGDALDLYLPPRAVRDPAGLPETGPVEGFRARIFPAGK